MNTKLSKMRAVCLAAILTFVFSLTAFAQSGQLSLSTPNNAPLYFTAADFTVTGSLEGIMITKTPSTVAGSIYYGNRLLSAGDVVPAEYLDQLCFIPRGNYESTAALEYMPIYMDEGMSERLSVSITVFEEKNTIPTAENVNAETYKNIAINGIFAGSDEDGDTLTYSLTSDPKRGTVEINGDTFTYTPNKNKVGKDKFSYTATDPNGNVSQEAVVTVQIKKPVTNVTYSDMGGNSSYYAALRLAEENIFIGESLGGQYFFLPDREVTRGEFLAMVINLIGMDSSSGVEETGFADDAATPVWVKPYISTALKSGIISGVAGENGSLVFRSEATLTKAEAAVILNNALNLTDSDATTQVFADSNIPTWAYQATVNLHSHGIIDDTQAAFFKMTDPVTRSDTAQMLSDAMDLLENRAAGKSLLSWAIK